MANKELAPLKRYKFDKSATHDKNENDPIRIKGDRLQ